VSTINKIINNLGAFPLESKKEDVYSHPDL